MLRKWPARVFAGEQTGWNGNWLQTAKLEAALSRYPICGSRLTLALPRPLKVNRLPTDFSDEAKKMPHARFAVDPRLASLLGESYRSSEDAVKELVDNAWEDDAPSVRITLPDAVTSDRIVVDDEDSVVTAA